MAKLIDETIMLHNFKQQQSYHLIIVDKSRQDISECENALPCKKIIRHNRSLWTLLCRFCLSSNPDINSELMPIIFCQNYIT